MRRDTPSFREVARAQATAHGGAPNTHPTERRIGFNVTYCAGHVVSRDGGGLFVCGGPTTAAVEAQVAKMLRWGGLGEPQVYGS